MIKYLKYLLIFLIILFIAGYLLFILPLWGFPFNSGRHGHPPLTPAWALKCWLWEDDDNTAERVDELLNGYRKYDIPVGTILIDSPWSTRYNDFNIDTCSYPEPKKWFKGLKESGYNIVLWMTPMVNAYSNDAVINDIDDWFRNTRDSNFLLPKDRLVKWWKGKGGFIDYSNPEALHWWRGMQKEVLEMGIDGWKLDGAATLFINKKRKIPLPFMRTSNGRMQTTRQYMDSYYRGEYQNGLKYKPDFVCLSRSMDRNYHPEGFAPIDAAPVCWVGDQKHHWNRELKEPRDETDKVFKNIQGFEEAINSILKSAKKGYNIVGSDIAGFSGDSIPAELYIRWAQFSTFCGLFLNGGHGERALWKRSEQELEIIRKYSWLHTELIPYMYSYIVQAGKGGQVLQRPLRGKGYRYMFGDNILILPIYEESREKKVSLPEGNWRYWFDDTSILHGKQTIKKEFPINEYPVYIKEGAIIPMEIQRAYTAIGDSSFKGYTTWLIYPRGKNEFTIYDYHNQESTTIEVEEDNKELLINLQGQRTKHILRIHLENEPEGLYGGIDHFYDAANKKLIIRLEKNMKLRFSKKR